MTLEIYELIVVKKPCTTQPPKHEAYISIYSIVNETYGKCWFEDGKDFLYTIDSYTEAEAGEVAGTDLELLIKYVGVDEVCYTLSPEDCESSSSSDSCSSCTSVIDHGKTSYPPRKRRTKWAVASFCTLYAARV